MNYQKMKYMNTIAVYLETLWIRSQIFLFHEESLFSQTFLEKGLSFAKSHHFKGNGYGTCLQINHKQLSGFSNLRSHNLDDSLFNLYYFLTVYFDPEL